MRRYSRIDSLNFNLENPGAFGGPCDKVFEADPLCYNDDKPKAKPPTDEPEEEPKVLFIFNDDYPSEESFNFTQEGDKTPDKT